MNITASICQNSTVRWSNHQYPFDDSWLNVLDFILFGVILCVIAVLGFVGNTLSIVVLKKCVMGPSLSIYLIGVAVFDNICIIIHVLMLFSTGFKSVLDINHYCGIVYPYIQRFQGFFIRTTSTGIGLSMAIITITRFAYIAYPLSQGALTTSKFAKISSVIIAIVSPLLCIMLLFEFDLDSCFNAFIDMTIVYRYRTDVLSRQQATIENLIFSTISVYSVWGITALFNCLLIHKIWQARKARRSMTTSSTNDTTYKTTIILLSVTISYVILIFPLMIKINVLNFFGHKLRYSVCLVPDSLSEVREGSALLFLRLCNSCINIIFYCMGSTFRNKLRTMFFSSKTVANDSDTTRT